MADRMLQFVRLPQRQPEKRAVGERRADFDEIYRRFDTPEASRQASRCSQCGVPFCAVHCPLGNDIPDWLKLAAEGRIEEAYEISAATNNFPEICGRICPQDRLCEGNCVIEKGYEAVTIGAVERFLTDTAFEQGWVRSRKPARERGLSVGIVGAGPAGLAAAEELRALGYAVDVYDRHDRIGGLLIYGIPNFKLEKDIVLRRAELLAGQGVRFHLGVEVGRELKLAELRRRHPAVLIATGVYRARDLAAPGSVLPGIVPALDYLMASNRKGLGDAVPDFDSGTLDARDKRVVVIGGGDTAMDCVRTAVRQGARSVQCLYRRDRANMPGSMREVKNAEEEGVEFLWLSVAKAFSGADHVRSVQSSRMRLGLPDASGRQSVEKAASPSFRLDAELVIKALGFDPEDLPREFAEPDLAVTRWGTLKTHHRSFMTSVPGVFAAGDIVRGASLVVWAIRDGRDAAAGMHAYLEQETASLAVAAE
jgi:glutamate synthase (NADPH/NADH) small chain